MLTYNDIYETLRKEKYSESLQPLPKKFILDFANYISQAKEESPKDDLLSTSTSKQVENALSLFRELILKRKRKILNLIFVATETGIMKRDYENMLAIEKESFEKMTKTFEDHDKKISNVLNNKGQDKPKEINKMIIFKQDVEEFISHEGKPIGPFKSGELANLNTDIAQILVTGDKATFVDEN